MSERVSEYAERILGEVWRALDTWPYEVSSFGRVRRAKPGGNRAAVGSCLSPVVKSNGYCAVSLNRAKRNEDGDRRRWRADRRQVNVHRLVYEAFYGSIPKGMHINHRDGDKTNNRLANLECVTATGNMLHSYREGFRDAKGSRNGRSKLDEEKVREIRRLSEAGVSSQAIADRFSVSPFTIRHVIRGTRWSHVK